MIDKNNPILEYHEATKHHYHRLASAPPFMDWANQPYPFRLYEGAKQVELPLLKDDPNISHLNLYNRNNNITKEFNIKNLSSFLELSLGISAWKALNSSKWSLRMNPSSGNLHPVEAYLLLPQLGENSSGIYHYNAFFHSLDLRAGVSTSPNKFTDFGANGFFIGLSAVLWREAWKYGERAFRYCQLDIGHAIACISFSANLHGWKAIYLDTLSDDDIDSIFGLNKDNYIKEENECSTLVLFIHNSSQTSIKREASNYVINNYSNLTFYGKPNRLSKSYLNWDAINMAASTSRKKRSAPKTITLNNKDITHNIPSDLSAPQIIRNRRSGLSYNSKIFITKDQLISILDKAIPRYNHAPFDTEVIEPSIHILLFIHRVTGLKEGLYFLLRDKEDLNSIKSCTDSSFKWTSVLNTFPLYFLKEGNYQSEAIDISCHQDIAGNCAFTVAMLARFSDNVSKGNECYRRLFWEAGMIGQVLYLEAEANKLRGTGIGCYYDNELHKIIGLDSYAYQCLYQFALGGHFQDDRLRTIPPYHHLTNR